MSHLGELLTAFLDGELTGAERDRVTAHLAQCGNCRTEARALRELMGQLRELGRVPSDAGAELSRRLLALPDRAITETGMPAARVASLRTIRKDARRPGGSRRPASNKARTKPGKRRYVVFGAVSVVVGIGAAAFSMGGADAAAPGPRITPQVELFSEEHALTTGEVPFTGPPVVMAGTTGRAGHTPGKPVKARHTGRGRQGR
jgi:anti-sigma factor RsiW